MAIIGKIRNRSGLLVGFVFVALAIFVLSDFLGRKNGGGRGDDPTTKAAGEVFGQEVNLMEYEQEVQNAIEGEKQKAAQQGMEYNEEMSDRIREDVWNRQVNRIIFDKELAGFNTTITPAELNDLLFGNNIPEYITSSPMFKNQFGMFSVDSVKMLRQRVEGNQQAKQWWVANIETPVKETRKISKYFNLISRGLYVTKAEVMHDNTDKNRKFQIRYVAQQFTSIPDSTVKVSEDEIKDYYNKNKHRKKYESFGSRSFSYVEFMLIPTQADAEYAKKQAEGLYERFKTSKNDSAFVMTYSESKNFSDQFSATDAFSPDVDSLVQKADSGAIIGPYQDGDFWKIVKVRGVKFEDQAKVKHILVAYKGAMRADPSITRSKEDAKKLADSLLNAIKKGTKLDDLVMKYSDDGGKNSNGGTYDWFNKEIGFTPKFKDFAFEAKMGERKVVETEFGFHVMESMGQRKHKLVKAATVDVKIRPMKETDMAVRSKAVDFLSKIKESSKFQEVAQQMKLNVLTKDIGYNQSNLDGTQGTRQLAIWVQRANEGDMSENPLLVKGNAQMGARQPGAQYDRWVVVKLDHIRKKGVPELEDVREVMTMETKRVKKADMLAKQMQGAKSLEELATRLKTTVKEGEVTFMSPSFPNLEQGGTEFAAIGAVCAMKKPGDMTAAPLKGKNGVYVVMLSGITEATPLQAPVLEETRKTMTGMLRNNAQGAAYSALRELAKVEDNRPIN